MVVKPTFLGCTRTTQECGHGAGRHPEKTEKVMTHYLGPLVPEVHTVNETTGLDFTPRTGPLGGPRFVILHFDSVALSPGAKLTVDLGYAVDEFTADSGSSFWSRPANTREPDGSTSRPIAIRITGGTGTARISNSARVSPASRLDICQVHPRAVNPTATRFCIPIPMRSRSSRRAWSAIQVLPRGSRRPALSRLFRPP